MQYRLLKFKNAFLNRRRNQIIHNYKHLFGFYALVHPTMHRKQ